MRDRDTRVATHDEVKRQHAAGPLRVLAIRPSSAAAHGRTRCPKNRLHGVIAGKLYIYASDGAFAAGPTESRSQEKGIPA